LLGGSTFNDYTTDTMEQENSDEWTTETGDLTFVLKDNTFLLDEGSSGPVTTGSVRRGFGNRLHLETSLMYLEEEDFGDISESLALSEIEAAASLLGTYSGTPFVPPETAFTFNEWVSERDFEQQYEETADLYMEAYFDYVEQVYADMGYDINSMIIGWDLLKRRALRNSGEIDPTELEGYYEEPTMNYEITNTENERNLVFQGDGLAGQDTSFVSNIPTEVNYTGP
jgi:hypothetical protein